MRRVLPPTAAREVSNTLVKLTLPAATLAVLLACLPSSAEAANAYDSPQSYGLAWGLQSDIGYGGYLSAVDVADGVVWSVGAGNARNDGNSDAVVQRSSVDGRDLGHLVEGDAAAPDTASGVDAGPWGAVVTGTTGGVFPGSGATTTNGESGWVQLVSPSGEIAWTTQFGDTYVSYANGVAVQGNTVAVVGQSSGGQHEFIVTTFSLATGAVLTSRTFGTYSSDLARAVTFLGDDQLIVGGITFGAMGSTPKAGDGDAVVVALDPATLATRWITQIGTADLDLVSTLTTHDGVIYWGGFTGWGSGGLTGTAAGAMGALASDGRQLWQEKVGQQGGNVRSITTTSRGVVLGGDVDPGDGTNHDAYLEGRGFDGAPQWHLAFGAAGYDIATGVAESNDRVFFAGTTHGGIYRAVEKGSDALLGALDVATVLKPGLTVDTTAAPSRLPSAASARAAAAPSASRVVIRRGSTKSLRIRLHNDGLVPDSLVLRGCTDRRLTMKWKLGRRNISGAVRVGTYRTPTLARGAAQALRWQIKAGKRARGVVTCTLTALSTHDAKATDRRIVKIVVKRARKHAGRH